MSEFFLLRVRGVCLYVHAWIKKSSHSVHPFWCLMSSMKRVVIAGRLVALMVEPASQWAMCRRRDTTRNKKGRNQRTLRTHGPISRLFALWSSAQSPAQSGCCWAAVNICSLDLCCHSFPGLTWHRTHRPRISWISQSFDESGGFQRLLPPLQCNIAI